MLTCLELGEDVGHRTAGNLTATSPTCLGVGYIGGNDPKRKGQRHSPNASDSGLRNEACQRFRWILGFRFLYFFLGFFHSLFISSSSCIHLALQKLVAEDCTSERHLLTIDTIDEFQVQHPKLSLAMEILPIDGIGNLRRQKLAGYRLHPGYSLS